MTRSTPARLYQLRSNRTISPAAGRCGHVALEIPLGFSRVPSGVPSAIYAANARVQGFGDALDGAALAGSIPSLEQSDDLESLES